MLPFRQNEQFGLFWAKFGQKRTWSWKFIKLMLEWESASLRYHVCQFSIKTDNFDFLAQICPKRKLGFEIQITNVGIIINIFEIPSVPIIRQNGQLWIFGPNFAQKWILGSKFQKSKSGFRISILEILCVTIFRHNGQL